MPVCCRYSCDMTFKNQFSRFSVVEEHNGFLMIINIENCSVQAGADWPPLHIQNAEQKAKKKLISL
jgi:hypothetical protein